MELKLHISPNLTIEDIHKIREYNFEMTKNMTTEDKFSYYRNGAEKALKRMSELKEENKNNQ